MERAQILVVENEIVVAESIRNELQDLGYAVPVVTTSGEEAIRQTAETHPDLVLMDIRLAGDMDGVKAAEQIRARFDIPVIYLTAFSDDETLQRAKVTEPYGYVLKPLRVGELHSSIEMALYKHKMESKLRESKEQYRQSTENSSTPIFSANFVFANTNTTERRWAEDTFHRRNRELTLPNQAYQKLAVTLDMQQVAEQLLRAITEIVGAEGTSVWLWDEEQEGWLVCQAISYGQNLSMVNLRLSPGQGIAGWVAQTGESAIVTNTTDDPRFFPGIDESTGFRTISLLAAPIRARGEVIGVVEVVNKRSGEFDGDDLTLIKSLAASVALAIENARLCRELGGRVEQLEQQVQKRTAQFVAQHALSKVIFDSTADGIIVTDEKGVILQTNPIAHFWLTRTLSPEETDRLRKSVCDLVARVEERPVQLLELTGLNLKLSGVPISELAVERELQPIQGKPAAMVTIRDVSELKALDRMKSRLITNISHELRTPITAIKVCATLLQQMSSSTDDRWKKYLNILMQEADHLALLVADILQIAHIDAGRLEMKPCPVLLNKVAKATVAGHRMLARERGLKIEYRSIDTSGVESGPVALVDAERLVQVMDNLVKNAIRYTSEGGTVTISTGKREMEGRIWATATVADTGMGIPEDELPYIFDRFFRGEKPRSMQFTGTALGLSLVREIVELHGGRVTVESKEDVGSTFTIWLPIVD